MDPQPPKSSAVPDMTGADLARCLTPGKGRDALTVMMQTLVNGFDADGCVLWETYRWLCSPVAQLPDRILVMASWFQNQDGVYATHDTLIDRASGQAILSNTANAFPDLRKVQTRRIQGDVDFDLRSAVAAPVVFADGVRGAVTLYRCGGRKPFAAADCARLVHFAPIVPPLYKAIRDAKSLDLLIQVSGSLSALPVVSEHWGGVVPPQLRAVFDKVCKLIEDAFHCMEASLYLLNPLVDPNAYHLAGTTWTRPTLEPSFDRGSEGQGLAAWVLRNRKSALIFDWRTCEQDEDFYRVEYPGLTWSDRMELIADACRAQKGTSPPYLPPLSKLATPVFLGSDLVGVLRCSAGRLDPGAAGPWYYNQSDLQLLVIVAEAVARFWGFYLNQSALIHERNLLEVRAYGDLRHQLHNPLNQLTMRSERLLRSSPARDPEHERQLLIVRGLARKARSVALSIDFLATPGDDAPLRVKPSPLARDDLRKVLIELAQDYELMIDADRHIRFSVDRSSLDTAIFSGIRVDLDLLQQAISNLLDNAGKYSYSNTTVRISCGNTGKGNLQITVRNKGIPVRSSDIGKLCERGYQAEEAKDHVGEGSGIGLWIVRRIMKAHSGFVEIVPTNKEGEADVKLVFLPME